MLKSGDILSQNIEVFFKNVTILKVKGNKFLHVGRVSKEI